MGSTFVIVETELCVRPGPGEVRRSFVIEDVDRSTIERPSDGAVMSRRVVVHASDRRGLNGPADNECDPRPNVVWHRASC